jgi:hypothetical protein
MGAFNLMGGVGTGEDLEEVSSGISGEITCHLYRVSVVETATPTFPPSLDRGGTSSKQKEGRH